ncbi:MAG: hypothetical protein A2Y62_16955 [Candidatus Fischerbacteria bacterium RBG_13_37_8]|uniref:Uncharacterized protein n=1 Tax=Candidatus Fischerbacteria bacterium RBG_13_37_8 TaxID=1817863 RepID=A0A1F5VDR4_9BACT|nr:MAG: hypothetical protein A2Y62_16955 [Candidatus Fischerbacteria bacterium RBG_13_37_8]
MEIRAEKPPFLLLFPLRFWFIREKDKKKRRRRLDCKKKMQTSGKKRESEIQLGYVRERILGEMRERERGSTGVCG